MIKRLLCISLVLGSNIVSAEKITPLELIDRYAANRKAVEMHHIISEEISEYTNTYDSDINQKGFFEYESIQNGPLRELTIKKSDTNTDQRLDISSKYSLTNTVIWDGQQWSQVSIVPTRTPNGNAFFSKTDNDKARYTSVAYGGSCLDGIFYGDMEPIDLILKKSSSVEIRPEMEKVNGSDCYVVEAVTPHGGYSLWIDPKHGYNIAKAESHKTNNDKFLTGVAKVELGKAKEGRGFVNKKRPGSRESIHFYIDNVNFLEIDGFWRPMEVNYRIITEYDDRKDMYKKYHKRTYVNLKPDFKAIEAFIPEIPEDSFVFSDESPGIEYIWKNGKPVPRIDEGVLEVIVDEIRFDVAGQSGKTEEVEILDSEPTITARPKAITNEIKQEVTPKPSSLPKILIIIGLLVVGVAGYVMMRHIRKGQKI